MCGSQLVASWVGGMCVHVYVCVCVCVFSCVHSHFCCLTLMVLECAGGCMSVYVHVRAPCMCVCVHACVRVCVPSILCSRVCVCTCRWWITYMCDLHYYVCVSVCVCMCDTKGVVIVCGGNTCV